MEYDSYVEALHPKVQGTWNLHKHFLDIPLDFFIMLSSAAGIEGNPGQANYAAGSTFLDAIARFRASRRMPGVTLDLGAIQDVGYVSENPDLAYRLEKLGHVFTREDEMLAMVESAILDPIREVQSSQVISGFSSALVSSDPKFSQFRHAVAAASGGAKSGAVVQSTLSDQLVAAKSMPDIIDIICKALVGKLSHDFMISDSDIDVNGSLASYGVDSLVAVELRNWVARQMKADISIFDVLQSKSLMILATKIAVKSTYFNISQ